MFTNAIDGWAWPWADGVMHTLRTFSQHGPPSPRLRDWAGRWWSLWGTADLVPVGNKVFMVAPGFTNPFADTAELTIAGRDTGRVSRVEGYASYGEPVRRVRSRSGQVTEIWVGASQLVPEIRLANEMQSRYGRPVRPSSPARAKRPPSRRRPSAPARSRAR